MVVDQERGQLAYDAYCASVGGVAVNGDTLPAFTATPERVQAGWIAAAIAVTADVLEQRAHDRDED